MCCCGAHIPSGDVSLTSPSDRGREFPSARARSSLPARACLCETNDRPTTANQTTTTPPPADTTLLQLQIIKQSSTTTHSSKERRGSRETIFFVSLFSFHSFLVRFSPIRSSPASTTPNGSSQPHPPSPTTVDKCRMLHLSTAKPARRRFLPWPPPTTHLLASAHSQGEGNLIVPGSG